MVIGCLAGLALVFLSGATPVHAEPSANSPPKRQVLTIRIEAPRCTAEQVEKQVTGPLEQALGALSSMQTMRSVSSQGLSLIELGYRADPPADAAKRAAAAIAGVRDKLLCGTAEPVIEVRPAVLEQGGGCR